VVVCFISCCFRSIHDQSSPDSSDSGIQTDCSGLLADLPRLVSQLSRVSSIASSVGSVNNNLEDNEDFNNSSNNPSNIGSNNNNNNVIDNQLSLPDIQELWPNQTCLPSEQYNVTSSNHDNKRSVDSLVRVYWHDIGLLTVLVLYWC